MSGFKLGAWEFVVKGIDFLDTQLGVDYVATPIPLLWKVIREENNCWDPAIKAMIARLLKVLLTRFFTD
jgi:hypothetical protein